jgi:hypothetical protein
MTEHERAHELSVLRLVPRGWARLDWIKALRRHAKRDHTNGEDAEICDAAAYQLMIKPREERAG